ncbi:hypothetical protein [Clostridium sp.]|uniref:hypothetical protein n=1 Tax=Clostridium sp. TaxID=1506 RepID=UPI0032172102
MYIIKYLKGVVVVGTLSMILGICMAYITANKMDNRLNSIKQIVVDLASRDFSKAELKFLKKDEIADIYESVEQTKIEVAVLRRNQKPF